MKRSIICIIFLIVIDLLSPTSVILARQNQAPDIQAVKKELKILRGLDFKRDVPWSYKSREELMKTFSSEIQSEKNKDEMAKSSAFLTWMHLVPDGFDLSAFLGSYLSENVAGFYQPRTKTFYLTRDKVDAELPENLTQSKIDPQKITALHEMDHALQDQYFDLVKLMTDGRKAGNDDIDIMIRTFIEGDATYVTIDGLYKELNLDLLTASSLDDVIRLLFCTASSKKSKQAPSFLRASFSAPYVEGFHFVKEVILQGGWDLVNGIYDDLPDSTEQILHPQKYLVQRDFPYTVSMASIADEMPEGWKKLEENTLGELQLKLVFNSIFPSANRSAAYEGWGGDTYRIYTRDKELFAIWLTVWDTPKDANEFFDGYAKLLKKKYDDLKIKKETKGFILEGATGKGIVSMETRDKMVLIIENAPQALVVSLREKLWSCQVERKEHPVKVIIKEWKKKPVPSAAVTTSVGADNARIEYNMYTNGYHGFSLQKPASWLFKPSQHNSRSPISVGNLNTGAFVIFQIIPSTSPLSQDVLENTLTTLSIYALNGFSKTGKGTSSIGGYTFCFVKGMGTDKSTRIPTTISAYGAEINKRVFFIIYVVPSENEAESEYDINSLMQSIKFM